MSTPSSFARHKQHPRHSTARSLDPYRSEDALERLGPAGPDKDSSVSMSTASDSTAFPWHMTHASPPVEGAQHDKQVIPAHRAAADACRVRRNENEFTHSDYLDLALRQSHLSRRERIHPLGLPQPRLEAVRIQGAALFVKPWTAGLLGPNLWLQDRCLDVTTPQPLRGCASLNLTAATGGATTSSPGISHQHRGRRIQRPTKDYLTPSSGVLADDTTISSVGGPDLART